MRAFASGMTDVGLQRDHNEDSYAVLQEFDLFIVADGMGGHRAGDVASRLATDSITEFFRSTANDDATWPIHFDANLTEDENRLLSGIMVANRRIFERSIRSRECAGMGTTVVSAVFSRRRNRLYVGHVGDSRAYRVRGGRIRQLTDDHSIVGELLRRHEISADDAREHPHRHVLTRALGVRGHVQPDLAELTLSSGDLFVLCSDGLTNHVEDHEIAKLAGEPSELEAGCAALIELANRRGGEDNITVALARYEDE
jgi:serine/threonine protein phosphatase PrpC